MKERIIVGYVPLVGVPACYETDGSIPYHMVDAPYIEALIKGAGVLPVVIPAIGSRFEFEALLARLDGVLIPGSLSNIEPWRYRGVESVAGTLHDPVRDETTLNLIPEVITRQIPLLTICRGTQELNVALGGTLHQKLQDLPNILDHRADNTKPNDDKFAPVHDVQLTTNGMLDHLAKLRTLHVNSLHEQGIDRLAAGLTIEAVAPDGVIEAVRVSEVSTFALGFQWHPEWKFEQSTFSTSLFHAFGEAVLSYARSK